MKPAVSAPVGGNPGKTGLFAWYDFNDRLDSHTGGIDLVEQGNPSYVGGVGITPDDGSRWIEDTDGGLQDWGTTNADATLAVRWRITNARPGVGHNYYLNMHNALTHIRDRNTYVRYRMLGVTLDDTGVNEPLIVNQWYTTIMRWDSTAGTAAEGENSVLVNDAPTTPPSIVGTHNVSSTIFRLPGNSTTGDFETDWLSFWERRLTDQECSWLYNGG